MKINKTKLYATALAEVLAKPSFAKASAGEEGKIIKNFVKILVAEGLEKKAKEILEMAEEMVLAKQGNKKMNLPGLKPWVSCGYPPAQAYACINASREILHPPSRLRRDSGLGSSLRQSAGYSPKVE